MFVSPADPSQVVRLTVGDFGPFDGSLMVSNSGFAASTFNLAADGVFPLDGDELTLTLLDADGAAVPFVFDTTSSIGAFLGGAVGPTVTAGALPYPGAH